MLRLSSTTIGLNSRDLSWHTERHDDRQTRRAKGQSIEVTTSSTSPQRTEESPRFALPDRFLRHPLTKQNVASNSPLDSIISGDPVLQSQRSFWDGILADAGTIPRIYSQDLARHPMIVEPSQNFLKYHNSSKGSVQGLSSHSQDLDRSEDHSAVAASIEESDEEVQVSADDESTLASQNYSKENPNFKNPSEQKTPHSSRRRRRSIFSFHRKSQETPGEDPVLTVQARFSGQIDLDGSFDPVLAPSGHWTRSSTAENPTDSDYQTRHDYHPRAEPSNSEAGKLLETDSDGSLSSMDEPANESTPPQLPQPRSVELFRRRSGALPRSPLWISRTEISSSPDKRPRSPTNSSERSTAEISGFLSQPPRRRRKYKPRTETYSYVESENSMVGSDYQSSKHHFLDGSVADYPPSSPPEVLEDPGSSPPTYYNHSAAPSSTHQPVPSAQFTSHLSPLTTPFGNTAGRPLPFPPSTSNPFSPRLPPPFSATPRIVSFNLALPSSSSYPPHPPSSPPHTASPTSPTPPHTPTITIYNDALPPATQPQTPVGLPRNGLPAMSIQNPFGRYPYFTAPAGLGRNRTRTVDGWQGSATPTRRGREEQENVTEAEEAERRQRREGRRGRWEARGRLDETPEPEGL